MFKKKKATSLEQEPNIFNNTTTIQDLFCPDAIIEGYNRLEIANERYVRIYALQVLPRRTWIGWLDDVFNIGDVDISTYITPVPDKDVVRHILRKETAATSQYYIDTQSGNNARIPELEQQIADYQGLRDQVQLGQDKLFFMAIFIAVHATSEEDLHRKSEQLDSILARKNVLARTLVFQQLNGLKAILPLGHHSFPKYDKNVTSGAGACCLPLTISTGGHSSGVELGFNVYSKSRVFLDRFAGERIIPNQHLFVCGVTGSGKSVTLRFLALLEAYRGIRTAFIDPEGEYVNITHKVGGQVISLFPGRFSGINPLDLEPEKQEDGTYILNIQAKIEDVQALISSVFRYYSAEGLGIQEVALLEEAIMEEYRERGIEHNVDSLYHNGIKKPMPTLSDIHNRLAKKPGADKLHNGMIPLLNNGTVGMFDGQSTIQLDDKPMICFNLRGLGGDFSRFVGIQAILAWLWQKFAQKGGKEQPKCVAVDEAWMFLRYPGAAQYLEVLARRGRKHGCGLTIATQRFKEFVDSPEGSAVIDSCASVLVLRQEDHVAQSVIDYFHLSSGCLNLIIPPASAGQGIKDYVFHPCDLETVLYRVEHPATTGEAAELLRCAPQSISEKPEPTKTKAKTQKNREAYYPQKEKKTKEVHRPPKEKKQREPIEINLPELHVKRKLKSLSSVIRSIWPQKGTKEYSNKRELPALPCATEYSTPELNSITQPQTLPEYEPVIPEKSLTEQREQKKPEPPQSKGFNLFKNPKAGIIFNGIFYDKSIYKTAIEMLNEECDVIVIPSDWGLNSIRDFRRDPRSKIIPLVVLHGDSECLASGADICVKKLNKQVIDDAIALSSRLRSLWASIETDALTGVYSRKFLNTWLQERIRQKAPFSVVMLDIDHFKTVNDTYGHEAGDTVISCFGQFLKQQTRAVDVVGRYGGDEFIICLPNTSVNAGYSLIDRLREKWAERKILINDGQNIQCTFSAGIAQCQENIDVVALVELADKQLYLAKEKGRNHVQMAVPKILLLGQELSMHASAIRNRGLDVTIDPNEASVVICDIQSIQYAPANISLYILGKGSVVDWAASKLRPDASILYNIDAICNKILGIKEPELTSREEKDNKAALKVPNLSVLPGVRSGTKTQSIPLHGALYVVCPSKPAEASEMAAKLCQTISGAALICAAPESTAGVILKIPQDKLITSDWRFLGAEAPIKWAGITIWPVDPYKHSNVARLDEIQTLIDQIKSRFEITIVDCGARLDMCSRVAGDEGVIIIYTDGDSSDLVAQQWLKNCSTGKVISMSPAEIPNTVVGDNGFIISSGGRDASQKESFIKS